MWEETRINSGGTSHDGSGSGVFGQVLAALCGPSQEVVCRDAGRSKIKIRSETRANKNQLI